MPNPASVLTKKALLPLQGDFPLHKLLGVSPEVTRAEFLATVNQRDDLSNKLKALRPLLKDIGVDLESSEKQGNTQINIILSQPRDQIALKAEYEVFPPSPVS